MHGSALKSYYLLTYFILWYTGYIFVGASLFEKIIVVFIMSTVVVLFVMAVVNESQSCH